MGPWFSPCDLSSLQQALSPSFFPLPPSLHPSLLPILFSSLSLSSQGGVLWAGSYLEALVVLLP